MNLPKLKEKYGDKKVLITSSDNTGCGLLRTYYPFQFLKDNFVSCEHSFGFPAGDPRIQDADIIWLQRANHEVFQQLIPSLQAQGKKIIMDMDDTLWHIPATNLAHRHYPKKELDKVDAVCKLVDCLTASTQPLADFLSDRFNKEVFVIQNHIWKQDEIVGEKPRNEKIKIGWAGSYCYDEMTEVMTDSGWKYFKDLLKTDKVATLNPSTNMLEYHLPSEYVDEAYKGIMYHSKSRFADFMVTPNHNMYASPIKNICKKKINYQFHSMESLEGQDFHIKKTCDYVGEDVEYFTLPGVETTTDVCGKDREYPNQQIEMDDWLKFLGFWVTEGWTEKGDKSSNKRIGFAQHKDNQFLNDIERIAIKYGWKYSYTKNGTNLIIFGRHLWEYFKQFGKAHDKFIPREFLKLSSRQLKILFEWMINGDGTRSGGRYGFCSSSPHLINAMSEIALKIGFSANIYNCGKRESFYDGRVIKPRNDTYLMKLTHLRSDAVIYSKDIEKVEYDGRIYCVTVPYHTLFVRRNGKTMWCGNTHLGDFDHHLVNVLRGLPYDKVEFYSMGFTPQFFKPFAQSLPWVETKDFHNVFSAQNWDIGIMVAQDNMFSRCKSNLKYLEYGSIKCAAVGHSVYPYVNTIEHGVDGLLIKKEKTDWKEYIYRLIEDEPFRKQIADAAYEKVNKFYTYEGDSEALEQKYIQVLDYLYEGKN